MFVGFKYILIVTFELEFTSPFIRKAVTSLLILFNSPEKVVHTLSESMSDPASSFVLMFSSVVVYKVKSVPPSISNPFRTYEPWYLVPLASPLYGKTSIIFMLLAVSVEFANTIL